MSEPADAPLRTALVFAHECAPFNRVASTVGAQRPAQFAKHLPRYGWRAVVLCCDVNRRRIAEPADEEHVAAEIADEVRAQLRNADPTSSLVIATPSLAYDGRRDRAWHAAANRPLFRKALTVAKYPIGDYSQSWQPCARWAAEALASELSVDVCVGEHSPDAGLFLARWFSKRYGVPWVADFRDPVLEQFAPLARRLYRPVITRLVRSAAATIAPHDVFAAADAALFGRPAVAIPNGYDPDEFADLLPPSLQLPGTGRDADYRGPFVIGYAGNIRDERALDVFLDGLLLADGRSPGRWRFRYTGLASDRVAARAAAKGASALTEVHGFVERSESLGRLARADMLLALTFSEETGALRHGLQPAKVFEYFGLRRPILAVPGDDGLLDALLAETGAGVVAPTAHDVARVLCDGPGAFEPNHAAIAAYERSSLTGHLASLFDRVRATRLS